MRIEKERPTREWLRSLADKSEAEVAAALYDLLRHLPESRLYAELLKRLAEGDVSGALTLLETAPYRPAAIIAVQTGIRLALERAGAATTARLPPMAMGPIARVEVAFDPLNPRILDYLRRYPLDLVQRIDQTTRDGVRLVISEGVRRGENPRTVARAVRPIIGLTGRQAQAVMNFRRELETFHLRRSADAWNLGGQISRAPGGAQVYAVDADGNPLDGIIARRLRDFRFDSVLRRALQTGKPLTPEQIDRMVAAYARKYRRYRAQMIARTEAIRATNAGNFLGWQQAAETGVVPQHLVFKRWLVAPDERLCPTCRGIADRVNGQNNGWGIPLNVPFDGALLYPPAHPACRCTVLYRLVEPDMVGLRA